MASEEHLEILKQGVDDWNIWRSKNPDVKPNLTGADLRGWKLDRARLWEADLTGANLTGAKLQDANLTGAHLLRANLTGAELPRANLTEANLTQAKLARAYLAEVNLTGARLWEANLTEANLIKADLTEANLTDADLTEANLTEANLTEAKLARANLTGANLSEANLTEAKLARANLTGAHLSEANLTEANLTEADLTGANLTGAKLPKADLWAANLDNADVTGAKIDRHTKCRGIRVATCYGSPRFKRMAQDNDFLEELRSTKRGQILYTLWSVFADCGRTPWRWIGWSFLLAAFFALVFCWLGPGSFEVRELPHETFRETYSTMFYYSIVTFTTLGFGDITPNTPQAARWVMAEVITGYMMLGGLISILANILARRS